MVYKIFLWNKMKKKNYLNVLYLCIEVIEVNLIGIFVFVEQNNFVFQFFRIFDKKIDFEKSEYFCINQFFVVCMFFINS